MGIKGVNSKFKIKYFLNLKFKFYKPPLYERYSSYKFLQKCKKWEINENKGSCFKSILEVNTGRKTMVQTILES